ncbi:hypothetical protein [Amycolatopsis sp. NPDC051371]|uniref:hypothetical protein n=1 Tax=Amycolatopsis sp. NPDC051371 TaxID=3155800 RepID=UPI00341B01A0
MKQKWHVLRWPLTTSLLSTALAVFVNLATDLKDSWIAWVAVGVLTVSTGLVSAGVQHLSARKANSEEVSSTSIGNTTTSSDHSGSVTVNSERIGGNVHIHQAGRRTFVVEVIAVAVAALVVVYLSRADRQPATTPSTTAPTGLPLANAAQTPSASTNAKPSATTNGPLQVAESWPLSRGCDGGTQIAMINGGPGVKAFSTAAGDERQQMISAGAGVWGSGMLYLDLTAPPQKSMRILNLRPLIDTVRLPPPTWIYSPEGGCGGPTDRSFDLDLDKPSLKDKGAPDESDTADVTKLRREPIGPAFTVSPDQPATLRFDVTGCRANYQWNLEVTYSVDGDQAKHTYVAGPFRTMGFADKTKRYTRALDGSFTDIGTVNGVSDDGWCR